jgi:hypothetical protein
MYEQLNAPEQVEQVIKGQAIQRLAEQIYNELKPDFYVESNPFVGETHIVDAVAMPTSNWKKIESFLIRNNFNFSEL